MALGRFRRESASPPRAASVMSSTHTHAAASSRHALHLRRLDAGSASAGLLERTSSRFWCLRWLLMTSGPSAWWRVRALLWRSSWRASRSRLCGPQSPVARAPYPGAVDPDRLHHRSVLGPSLLHERCIAGDRESRLDAALRSLQVLFYVKTPSGKPFFA